MARLLPDGQRLHLQHGPIDLIIGAEGAREVAFKAARARFETVLQELVAELPLLRRAVGEWPAGGVARRMVSAVRPHGAQFVTPMAAVAGAVAEEVLAAMVAAGPLARAYVNNGGDIAFHLGSGERFRMAVAGLDGAALGRIDVGFADAARGVATSGRGGRSFSLGIADAVTVLARTAAEADVAATMICNAVDFPGHVAVLRAPADSLQPDSDLGSRLVTVSVGALTGAEVAEALARGVAVAEDICGCGLALSAALFLNGQARMVGQAALTLISDRSLCDA
ncbi:UPF0280 family protein [Cypionkella sp.]|uniref:UPF0280 family protein n=1 Tax=Cypionkella sp. TaxID=2811411 RepID=UPI002AB8277A|nr:UPF0280 family protein [Cypionkella sp.]MDZ4392215.1 UPF0280 family protein [Cypionkella sp.]